jgi:hypothetical protein
MKPTLTLSLAILLLFAACSKHNSTGPTGTTPPPTTPPTNPSPPVTMKLNLTTSTLNEEIIFSDSGGKVLLDTMSPYPNPLVVTLQTSQKLIDVSFIWLDTAYSLYYVNIYKSVDPSKWSTFDGAYGYSPIYSRLPSGLIATASAVYKNVPLSADNDHPLVTNFSSGFGVTSWFVAPDFFDVTYQKPFPTNYVYLIFPIAGLYNFHLAPSGGQPDTVDLSLMDTAVTITSFTKPSDYTIANMVLNGILDTTDLSKSIFLYEDPPNPGAPALQYPKKMVQVYDMNINASNSDGYVNYETVANTINPTLPFPEPSTYSITSSAATNFSVSFNGIQPAFYSNVWTGANISLTIYAPGDTTSFNAQSLITNLKSKMLQGQSFSNLKLSGFSFTELIGIDYSGVINLEHNPSLLTTQHVPSSMTFSKSF